MSRTGARLVAAMCATVVAASGAEAASQPLGGIFDSVGVFAGQGVDHNKREMPKRILQGTLEWESSYFTAIGLGKVFGTLGESIGFLDGRFGGGIRHGYEVVGVQHRGMQSNAELGAAYKLITPDLNLGPLAVNFGFGVGLSYAFGTPTYEDGPRNDPERRYRRQLLALYDLEWRLRSVDNLALVTRLHHRSGVYGFIAPRHVGSNFLAVGMRYGF